MANLKDTDIDGDLGFTGAAREVDLDTNVGALKIPGGLNLFALDANVLFYRGGTSGAAQALAVAANAFPARGSTGAIAAKPITDFGLALVDDADASAARTTLGLVIGTHVQAQNANLNTFAGITPSANVQTILGAVDFSAIRTTLGLVIGTHVQAWSAALDVLAAKSLSGTGNIVLKSYVDDTVASAVTGLQEIKGSMDCSGNPNYPAASSGDTYRVSAAGRIGGASGPQVSVGDMVIAFSDNAGGTHAAVGTSWAIGEANIQGITATGVALVTAADAAAARATLGLAIGTDVQAHSSNLDTFADITPGAGVAAGILSRPVFATTAASGSMILLTASSALTQEVTAGAAPQIARTPNPDTLVEGWAVNFINKSAEPLTLQSLDNSIIVTLASGQSVTLVCRSIVADATAAAWDVVGLSPRIWVAVKKNVAQTLTDGTVDAPTPFQTILGGNMQGAWNTTTGEFTAPWDGLLKISGLVQGATTSQGSYQEAYYELKIKRGGSQIALLVACVPAFDSGSLYYSLNENPNSCVAVSAGDVLSVVSSWNENYNTSLELTAESQIQIEYL